MMTARLILAGFLLCLAACGFEPLYATGTGSANVPTALRTVSVAPLSDRSGQLVQIALEQRLRNQDVPPDYQLDIDMQQSTQFFGIRGDAAPTRQRVRMVASYRLINLQTETEVFSDDALADSTIDIVDSEYATFIAEEAAVERNAQVVADRILSRLALYFRALAQAKQTP
ncbi:MAG: LPS assembly lipoprotein LptE [Pseudomonadota bacterium]